MADEPTRILIAVNQSTINGNPNPSISSTRAFQWTLEKIVRSHTSDFNLLFLHVQFPNEQGVDADTERARGERLLGYTSRNWGDPVQVICLEVRRVRPDLLVVGNRGLNPFRRVFAGCERSLFEAYAECPVIAIPRRAEETPEDPTDD